jgi:hypothetical protein
MNYNDLAHELVKILTPALPILLRIRERAIDAISEASFKQAQKIWEKLHAKIQANAPSKNAVEELARDPENTDWQEDLEFHLQKILSRDPQLASEISQIVPSSSQQTQQSFNVSGVNGSVSIDNSQGKTTAGRDFIGGDYIRNIAISFGSGNILMGILQLIPIFLVIGMGASHFRENRVRGENREVAPEKTHHDTRRPKAPGILYGRNCRDFVPQ